MFIHFWERESEREKARVGEGQREWETQNLKQAPGSSFQAISTKSEDTGLKLGNHEIMPWAEVGRLTDWATQAPQMNSISKSLWRQVLRNYKINSRKINPQKEHRFAIKDSGTFTFLTKTLAKLPQKTESYCGNPKQ